MKKKSYKIILSVGSSAYEGQCTPAISLVKGLKSGNNKVSYIKFTGAIFNKTKAYISATGADHIMDFTDFGFASTAMCNKEELLYLYCRMIDEVNMVNPDYLVIDITDGLMDRATMVLLSDETFRAEIDYILYNCDDNLTVLGGLEYLKMFNLRPFAISGLFTQSPEQIGELQKKISVPVTSMESLACPSVINYLGKKKIPSTMFKWEVVRQAVPCNC